MNWIPESVILDIKDLLRVQGISFYVLDFSTPAF